MIRLWSNFAYKFSKRSYSGKILFFGSDKVAYPTVRKLAETYDNLKVITHYSDLKKSHNDV